MIRTSLLQSCINLDSIILGRKVHTFINRFYVRHPFVDTKLVSMYAKCRCLVDARKVFNGMCQRNLHTWSIMIGACLKFTTKLVSGLQHKREQLLKHHLEANRISTHERIVNTLPLPPTRSQSSHLHQICPFPLMHVSSCLPSFLSYAALPPLSQLLLLLLIFFPLLPLLIPSSTTLLSPLFLCSPPSMPSSNPLSLPTYATSTLTPPYLYSESSPLDSITLFSGFMLSLPLLVSPYWNNCHFVTLLLQQEGMMLPPRLPTSPLPFGCLNSSRSLYPLLSPSLLLSP